MTVSWGYMGYSVLSLLSRWSKTTRTKTSLVMGPRERRQGRVSTMQGLPSPGSTVVQPGGELSEAVEWLYRIMSTVDGLCWQMDPGWSKSLRKQRFSWDVASACICQPHF